MKSSRSFLTIAIVSLSSSLMSLSVYAFDGRINFIGQIVDPACQVNTESTVTLGDAQTTAFKKIGDTSQTTSFNIQLSNCPSAARAASISFSGTPHTDNPEILQVNGNAQGVGIELVDSNSQQRLALRAGQTDASTSTRLQSGKSVNTLTFGARYVSTSHVVTPGSAAASADFTVTYQ
ncbi:MAG: fimbrial protein [Ottowia sp.]|nr:fimbrial protein [Ottowia sp.]